MRTRDILVTLVLAGLVVSTPAEAAPQKPQAAPATGGAILRSTVTVNDPVIRLGDLFINAGDKAEIAIAHSPAPGKKQVFDARTLYRLANAHGLPWRPLNPTEQAVVERESTVVTAEEIETLIKSALLEKGLDSRSDVEIGNRMLRLHLPIDAAAGPTVEDVTYDVRTHRFAAVLVAPSDGRSNQRVRVTGRTLLMAEVPVLNRRLLAGETIGKQDIQWVKVASDRLQTDTIVAAEDLVGKAAKQGLRVGAPVRTTEVRRPILVEKGSLVTIVLKRPQMLLTSQGRALESGSEGETVRITNTFTNAVVEAQVTGINTVTARPLGTVLSN
ncbi:MAG: flagellar basal body P-ring formation protein FlgA [Rhodospirillales bacterium]|nr:flagellar basal body P-ring formation protein FlgA [Rhodospirillales bacterium]